MHRPSRILAAIVGSMALFGAACTPTTPPTNTGEVVSISSAGVVANDTSGSGQVSADGRVVSFSSAGANLVADDTNGVADIFVHDRDTGETARVSVASDGSEADGASSPHALSGDGRYVAFWSEATNLVAGDTNGVSDVFVHDRQTGATERVSVATGGVESNAVDDPPSPVGGGVGPTSFRPYVDISDDGQVVVFVSGATNLVVGDANGVPDVFVRDRSAGTTERASVADDGSELNVGGDHAVVSGDGQVVAFASWSDDVVAAPSSDGQDVYVHDLSTGDVSIVSVSSTGQVANLPREWPYQVPTSLSYDGQKVAFNSLSVGLLDGMREPVHAIYVHDRATATTTRETVSTAGTPLGGSPGGGLLSADGEQLVFDIGIQSSFVVQGGVTGWTTLWEVWRRDLVAGTTSRISNGPALSTTTALGVSADGSTIAATHTQFQETGASPPAPPLEVTFSQQVVFDRPV